MVQLWIVMTLVIAFAKMDLMVVNVISVKKDSQATNVMNANLISLVTTVINASSIISTTHCVKVCLNKSYFQKKILYPYLDPCDYYNDWIGDGECDDATNNAECGYDGGDCCGDDVETDFCNECICHQT